LTTTVVATCSAGVNHIDLKECFKRKIPVGYNPGVLTENE
jgi:lactate dehydrogenase-like 2-hydroxyacid dehydrogenase